MHLTSKFWNIFSLWIVLVFRQVEGIVAVSTAPEAPKKCTMERAYKMLGYNCVNLNLKDIPQYLKANVEVLDVSFNRIRDLNKHSFARYHDIKYLYLFENMIQNVEPDTFSHLNELEAIDLATNALTTIPLELFDLPLLRNIYLNSNALGNSIEDTKNEIKNLGRPIKAPLQSLNLADCRLKEIPNFSVLPDLLQLNVSSNPLTQINTQQFSPMCNLKVIDLNNTQMAPCTCQIITTYLKAKNVVIKNSGVYCEASSEEITYCPDYKNATQEGTEFFECMQLGSSKLKNKEAKTTWFSIAGGMLLFLVLFIGVLYYFHRRNVRHTKMVKTKGLPDVNGQVQPLVNES